MLDWGSGRGVRVVVCEVRGWERRGGLCEVSSGRDAEMGDGRREMGLVRERRWMVRFFWGEFFFLGHDLISLEVW